MEANCVQFRNFGNPEQVLTLWSKPVQRPGPGGILVRMLTRPINPSDLIPVRGAYAHRITLPAVPGYEGVGIVEETGANVSRELMGRRVLPLRGEGTWQELVIAPAAWAVPVPDSIEDYTAAQLYINPLTAWIICTQVLTLRPGDFLLINAGGSAIGRIFAQFAKLLGFRLIAVIRSRTCGDELLGLGASHVIVQSEHPLAEAVKELTAGRGANAALDCVGGAAGEQLAYCLRPQAALVTLGLLSGVPVNWPSVIRKTGVDVKLFHLRHWNERTSAEEWVQAFDRLKALIMEGRLTLMRPRASFALSAVKEAVCAAESPGGHRGKVFLES